MLAEFAGSSKHSVLRYQLRRERESCRSRIQTILTLPGSTLSIFIKTPIAEPVPDYVMDCSELIEDATR
jgi:hypothetical protein